MDPTKNEMLAPFRAPGIPEEHPPHFHTSCGYLYVASWPVALGVLPLSRCTGYQGDLDGGVDPAMNLRGGHSVFLVCYVVLY